MTQTLLVLASMFLLLQCVDGNSDLPFPWLTLTHSAHVLRLICTAPAESWDWSGVYGLKLSALLPHYSVSHNTSLANITSANNELKVNSIFPVSRPTFTGSWESKTATLSMIMPITHNELGHYFCSGDYKSTEGYFYIFSNRMTVDKEFLDIHRHWKDSKTSGKFEVGVEDASKLDITWRRPDMLKFKEASVTRTITDPDGNNISPPHTLLTTVGARDFELRSSVLLSKSFVNKGQNYSMVVYVASEACYLYCRYDCSVSYKSCIRSSADSCVCRQAGDRREAVTSTNGPLADNTVATISGSGPMANGAVVNNISSHVENCTATISSSGPMTYSNVAIFLSVVLCVVIAALAISIYMCLRYRRQALPSTKRIHESKNEEVKNKAEKKPLLEKNETDMALNKAGRNNQQNYTEEEMKMHQNTNIPVINTIENNRGEGNVTNNENPPPPQTVTQQVHSADTEISPSPQRNVLVEQGQKNMVSNAGVAGKGIPAVVTGKDISHSTRTRNNDNETDKIAGAGSATSASYRRQNSDDKAINGNSHAVQVHSEQSKENFGHTDTASSFMTPQPHKDERGSGKDRENPTSMQPSGKDRENPTSMQPSGKDRENPTSMQPSGKDRENPSSMQPNVYEPHAAGHREEGDNSSHVNVQGRHMSGCQPEDERSSQFMPRTDYVVDEKDDVFT